jgi:hypothetical protein
VKEIYHVTETKTVCCLRYCKRTLLPRRGELLAYHVSCLSLWQWAKHELMNTPFCVDAEKPLTEASISFLKPASHIVSQTSFPSLIKLSQ